MKKIELFIQNFKFLDTIDLNINEHRAGDYKFTPVGIAQGTSPARYAEAVHR